MNFGSYEFGGGRSRRRNAQRNRRIMMVLCLIGGICAMCYWWGGERERTSQMAYKEQAMQLQKQHEETEAVITGLRSDVQSTTVRYKQLEQKYLQEVPQGTFKTLTDLVKKQLDSGIKPERLQLAIETARPPKHCTEPVVKRFVVKTPVYSGPQGAVAFGNGVVTVGGEGEASVNAQGKAEAWYDPGKQVKVTFSEIGGKRTVKDGLLPIMHTMVVGNKEYRFTIAAGERSFMSVTSDSCDYP
jgi:hypothetical protein